MKVYWKDYQGHDENFWEHEWSKHGTCISTLDPPCFGDSNTAGTDGVVPYFSQAVSLFRGLPTYEWLANVGIVPSNTVSYPKAMILAALKDKTGYEPYLGCQSGALNEVWYFYNVQGSLVDGTFEHAAIVGKTGSCGATVKYLPKSSAVDPTPPSSGNFSGKGYLRLDKGGCLISSGKWYKSGTCATFNAVPVSGDEDTFTLTSSKGACAVVNDEFTCSRAIASGYALESVDGSLGRAGFSTNKDISGSVQASVYAGQDHDVPIQITWQAR
ncbi:protein of unknown function [Taphrina deformans PYCC 5710]|uniref:ribonuclease T2 n=1 Tax=Taphrina deformans (strain PYCC 5710 / ATCC 11124 / CBS 356.35 / IMI 108563 / JCM 9778 / NBRC 8474) TaxID=1097556 RepID=R4XJP2_TAPDE|nr:protein of unknown function [Taphrina deformans PYCC 5710]|eukprot:CCG84648.1 protein of unknown function [Taphrina deformans PYCC 5710]